MSVLSRISGPILLGVIDGLLLGIVDGLLVGVDDGLLLGTIDGLTITTSLFVRRHSTILAFPIYAAQVSGVNPF